MTDIKNKLIQFEEEFYIYKNKIERFHKIFLFFYFLPAVIALIFYYINFQRVGDDSSLFIKIIIIVFIAAGLILHFVLRHLFHKSRNRYKKFITDRLDKIKIEFKSNEKFIDAVIENTEVIFKNNGYELSNKTINDSPFWNLLFIYLGIEMEE